MSGELKDILSHLNPETDQEVLLQYLQGRLNAAQQHNVEEGSLQDDFDADALEGLGELEDKKNLQLVVEGLNKDLKKRTGKKKHRRKPDLKIEPWLIITILTVIVLVIISFFILHRKAYGG
jgi:hypothetical protein